MKDFFQELVMVIYGNLFYLNKCLRSSANFIFSHNSKCFFNDLKMTNLGVNIWNVFQTIDLKIYHLFTKVKMSRSLKICPAIHACYCVTSPCVTAKIVYFSIHYLHFASKSCENVQNLEKEDFDQCLERTVYKCLNGHSILCNVYGLQYVDSFRMLFLLESFYI